MSTKRKAGVRPPRVRAPRAAAAPLAPPQAACLPAALTMHELGPVAARLRAALDAGVAEIDASAVATVDTAGVQLLAAAAVTAAALGRPLRLRAASPALTQAAVQLGLAVPLGLGAGAAGE